MATVATVIEQSVNRARWCAAFARTDVYRADVSRFPVDSVCGGECAALIRDVDAWIARGAADESDAFIDAAARQCAVWMFG